MSFRYRQGSRIYRINYLFNIINGKKNDKGANEKNTTNNNVDSNDKGNGDKKSSRQKNQNQKKSGFKPKRAKVKCQITELKGFAFNCTGYRQAKEFKEAKKH